MNGLVALLARPEGRIGRGRFWLGLLLVVALSIILGIVLIALGFGQTITGTSTVQIDGGTTQAGTFFRTTLNPIANLVLSVITTVPLAFIAIKRRHDRGSPGIDAMVILAFGLVVQMAHLLISAGPFLAIPSLVELAGGIYLLVVLGFLKGIAGTNPYGPDPLAR